MPYFDNFLVSRNISFGSVVGKDSNTPFDPRTFSSTPKMGPSSNYGYSQAPFPNMAPTTSFPTPNLGILNQPIVQDISVQYGQQVCTI